MLAPASRSSDDAAQAWRRLVKCGGLLVALSGLAMAAVWLSLGAQPQAALEQKLIIQGSGNRRITEALAELRQQKDHGGTRRMGITEALAELGRTEALAVTRAHMLKVVCRRCVLLCCLFSAFGVFHRTSERARRVVT